MNKLTSFLHVTLRMVVSCISPSPEVLSAARQASNRPSSCSVMVMMTLTVIKKDDDDNNNNNDDDDNNDENDGCQQFRCCALRM